MTVALVALALLLWKAGAMLMLLFAGSLLAIFLNGAAQAIRRPFPRLPYSAALFTVVIALAAILAGAGLAFAPAIAEQAREVGRSLAEAWANVESYLGPVFGESGTATNGYQTMERYAGQIGGIFSTTLGAISGLLIILFTGLFFAWDPDIYARGFLRLIPPHRRKRLAVVIDEAAATLRWWLVCQFLSMLILTVQLTIGLLLLGVPLAVPLAVLSGLLTFVPYLGPIVSTVPGVLIALSVSPELALWTLLLYLAVQNIEAYLLMPLIYFKTVHIPPVLTLGFQLLLGTLGGLLGVIIATPLLAALLVVVKRLYVEDTLRDSMDRDLEAWAVPHRAAPKT